MDEEEMNAPRPTETPTSAVPIMGLIAPRSAPTLLREVLRRIEGWQWSLRCGNTGLVQKDMAEVGCEIDDFLEEAKP